MTYSQITQDERYQIQFYRRNGLSAAAIGRAIGRHRSTVLREVRRNAGLRNWYDAGHAQARADRRRHWSRRNQRLSGHDWGRVVRLLKADWSPEQIAGRLRRTGQLRISHSTIYKAVWHDRAQGGELYRWLRHGGRRRARYGSRTHRARILGRPLEQRPRCVEQRKQLGHWEVDTIAGGRKLAALTLVERKTGFVVIGALRSGTAADLARRAITVIRAQQRKVRTITADNGSEMANHRRIERLTGARFYFANPYHAWERGTNENTNGLVRQYWPKGESLEHITQYDCNAIARRLNTRPRKRLEYLTPKECYERKA
jgi:IS30 family transposase